VAARAVRAFILQSASRAVDDPAYQVSFPPLVPRHNRSPPGWLLCRCPEEPDNPREGGARFAAEVMPPLGERLDKLGQRALNQGAVIFDNVVLPVANVLAGPDDY
jgi:hypothetical protein